MIVAVIPAFNEEDRVADVVRRCLSRVDAVVVVDDGSRDATGVRARAAGARVVRHVMNRGLGAALTTGLYAALSMGASVVVTLDADGQHRPEEMGRLVEALARDGNEAALGSRMLTREGNMPLLRRVYQRVGNALTFVLFGASVTDSQCGFRAFSRSALERMHLQTDRMEVSSEIVSELHRRGIRFVEVPVTAVYTPYSLSKGQSFRTGVRTAFKMVLHRLRP